MGTIQQTRMQIIRVVDLVPYFKKNYVAKKLCSNPERILIYQGFGTFIWALNIFTSSACRDEWKEKKADAQN